MVTLKVDGTWAGNVGPESPAGATGDRLIGNDLCAVDAYGRVPIHKGEVEALPLAGGFAGIARGLNAAINRANIVSIRWLAITVGDLCLINTARINSAIAMFRAADFQPEVEVFKFLIGAQIAEVFMRFALFLSRVVGEKTLLGTPAIDRVGIGQAPAAQVFAIKKLNRRSEFDFAQIWRGWERR